MIHVLTSFRFKRFTTIIVLMALVGIGSTWSRDFPTPGRDDESSLLGIYIRAIDSDSDLQGSARVTVTGPEELRVTIRDENWEVFWFRVKPGRYTLRPDEGLRRAPRVPAEVEVPPSSIVLAPFGLVRSAEGVSARQIDESDRQRAGRRLVSYVDYPVWSGRDLIGFGTLRPELDSETLRYKVAVSADPEGADVYVDDILTGTTPIDFELTGGKHRILVRAEGYEDAIYFIRLEGDAEIEAALEPAAETAPVSTREQYGTLVAPFVSVGETNDQLARLFADTLLLTLEEDDRLDVVPSTVPWERRDALVHPNFLKLEEAGADLVVSGFFIDDDEGLTIQANLYDVQAETVRAAVTWQGIAGLDIFDAMDEIALEFAAEVDRVLPEAGRTLVTRTETVYGGADRGESLLSRKKIIRRRWSDYPNVLTLQSGFGGFFESYDLEDNVFSRNASKFDGPYLPLLLKWDRTLNSRFAVGGGINITIGDYRADEINNTNELLLMGGLHAGPRAVFRSLRSDIIMSIDMEVQYSPEADYSWFNGGPQYDSVGPFVYFVTPVRIGFRYYLSDRIDRMPVFINGGLSITPVGYRFDLSGRGDEGFVDNNFAFELGAGVRL